jgi:DNA-binding response OmpR family regulator
MSAGNAAPSILVVDDEHPLADTLTAILDRAGYNTTPAYNAAEALAILAELRPQLIISDVMMPGMNGVDLAIEADKLHPGIQILLISGHAGTQDIVDAAPLDGLSIELLAKPVAPEELLSRVAAVLGSSPTEPTKMRTQRRA